MRKTCVHSKRIRTYGMGMLFISGTQNFSYIKLVPKLNLWVACTILFYILVIMTWDGVSTDPCNTKASIPLS